MPLPERPRAKRTPPPKARASREELDLVLALRDHPREQWLARAWLHLREARAQEATSAATTRTTTLVVVGDPTRPSSAVRALAERFGLALRLVAEDASGKARLPEARELYRAEDLLPRDAGLDVDALLSGAVDPDDGPHGAVIDAALLERARAARETVAREAPAPWTEKATRLLDALTASLAHAALLVDLGRAAAEAHRDRDERDARALSRAERRLRLPRALRRIADGEADPDPDLREPLTTDDPEAQALRGSVGGALFVSGEASAWRDGAGEVTLSGETPSGDRLYACDPEDGKAALVTVVFAGPRPVATHGEEGLREALGRALRLAPEHPGGGLVLEIARAAGGAISASYALSPAAPAGRAWKRAVAWSDGTCLLLALKPRFVRD